jgi:hypothetical protein
VEGVLTVADGGTLTLDSVDLLLLRSANDAPALVVEPGGTLVVKDSVIRAASPSLSDAVRVDLRGKATITSSTFSGLASDAGAPVGSELWNGFRIAPGGVLVSSSEVSLDGVVIRGSAGCAVTVYGASPTLRGLDISGVSYLTEGADAFAAGVCVKGGAPSIDGLTLAKIGDGVASGTPALYSAAFVADTPARLTLKGIDARGFAPTLAGQDAPMSVAILVLNPAFVTIHGGSIEGSTYGIVLRGYSGPSSGGSIAIEALSVVNTPSGPISQVGAYNSDPGASWSGLDITGCGGNGLYFESQNAGSTNAVTATVSNVTARGCGGAGVNMFDNGAQGPNYFNVWDSNASQAGQDGFYLHGTGMGGGLNVQMANNGAWMNGGAGIRVDALYNVGGAAKLASAKLEYNTADNNSRVYTGAISGGIILALGAPSTMSFRYLYNVARGNNNVSNSEDYGHYIAVSVTNSMTIGTGYMTGLVAENNGEFGIGLVGGASLVARFDSARFRDCRVLNQSTGVTGTNARMEFWNCQMSDSAEFSGMLTGFYVMGGSHNRLAGTTTGLYKIVTYKRICISGSWQNGAPLYLVPLSFTAGTNGSAASVFADVTNDPPAPAGNRQTDMNGNWSGWVLDWTFDPQATPASAQKQDFAPLTIAAQQFETAAKLAPFDLNSDICGPFTFIDPNTPTLIVNSPRENGTYTRSALQVQGSATDDLSGMAGVEISLGGTSWTSVPGPWSPFAFTFANLSDGTYDLYIRAWDRANDGLAARAEALVVLYTVTIDTVAPVLNILDPLVQDGGSYWTQNDNILFRGSVDPSVRELYVNGISINITGTAFLYLGPLPNEGPQSFLFLAIDGAGNARNVTVTIYKDKVDPTLIIVEPVASGAVYVASHEIVIRGITDPNTLITVNGVNASVVNATFSAAVTLTEGMNTVNITAVDAAGNRAARSLTVIADTVAPQVTLAAPGDGDFLNSSRVTLVGSTSEPVDYIEINLRIFQTAGLDFTAVLGLAEGRNGLWINATDRAGNTGQAHVFVTIDTVAPEITLLGLPEFLVVNNGFLRVQGSVSEDATLEIDGLPADLVGLTFDTTVTLTEGSNTFEVKATDAAGNRASLLRHVTLDTVGPTITITEPGDGVTVHGDLVEVVGTSEPFATVKVDDQLVVADASGRFHAWVPLKHEGANAVLINVTDQAGNSFARSVTISFAPQTVDTGGDFTTGLLMLVALLAGAAAVALFLARRRVQSEVEKAQEKKRSAEEGSGGTPGYTEAQQAPYEQAEAPAYYAQPEAGYVEQPYAPEPAGESAPSPPRLPRPPRPPTN